MTPEPWIRHLKETSETVRKLAAEHEAKVTLRDQLVQVAIEEGHTHAEISEATGLSRGRIGQIAQRPPVIGKHAQPRPTYPPERNQ